MFHHVSPLPSSPEARRLSDSLGFVLGVVLGLVGVFDFGCLVFALRGVRGRFACFLAFST